MIDLVVVPDKLERAVHKARKPDVIIQTFARMKDLSRIPAEIFNQTKDAGLWEIIKRRVHDLKYYTWVEQQGKTQDEMMDQWYSSEYWTDIQRQTEDIDRLIEDFNQQTGLIGQQQPEGLDRRAATRLQFPGSLFWREGYQACLKKGFSSMGEWLLARVRLRHMTLS